MPLQMADIHIHRGISLWLSLECINRIVFYVARKKTTMQPVYRHLQPTVWSNESATPILPAWGEPENEEC